MSDALLECRTIDLMMYIRFQRAKLGRDGGWFAQPGLNTEDIVVQRKNKCINHVCSTDCTTDKMNSFNWQYQPPSQLFDLGP